MLVCLVIFNRDSNRRRQMAVLYLLFFFFWIHTLYVINPSSLLRALSFSVLCSLSFFSRATLISLFPVRQIPTISFHNFRILHFIITYFLVVLVLVSSLVIGKNTTAKRFEFLNLGNSLDFQNKNKLIKRLPLSDRTVWILLCSRRYSLYLVFCDTEQAGVVRSLSFNG